MNAVEKAPDDEPCFVFIDINASREANADWQADVQRWMNRLPAPTPETPDVFNATYITNFSPHYDADDASHGGAWLVAWPRYARVPLQHDFQPELVQALRARADVRRGRNAARLTACRPAQLRGRVPGAVGRCLRRAGELVAAHGCQPSGRRCRAEGTASTIFCVVTARAGAGVVSTSTRRQKFASAGWRPARGRRGLATLARPPSRAARGLARVPVPTHQRASALTNDVLEEIRKEISARRRRSEGGAQAA
jgi:hypothetical protein